MDELRLVAPFSQLSGYSKLSRAVLRTALIAGYCVEAVESDFRLRRRVCADGTMQETREYPVDADGLPECQMAEVQTAKATIVSPSAPTLFVQIPESLAHWHEYSLGPRIGWTMIESDRYNPWWAKALEGVDLLLQPSRFCLASARRDSPHVHSELLPLPVDDRLWNADPNGVSVSRKGLPPFLFFSVFATIPRKGWQILCQAFAEEFRGEQKDVGLLLRPSRVPEVRELARWCNIAGAWVHVLDEAQSEEGLAAWYRATDCYVSPGAEGFGLPFVEAALCGLPSVALDRGGSADIVNDETGYPVQSYFAPIPGQAPHIYDSTHRFPTCDVSALRLALRAAYSDRAAKGPVARADAEHRFTPAVLATGLRQYVEDATERYRDSKTYWPVSPFTGGYRGAPRWCLLVGDGYGDAMAVYGNALNILRARDYRPENPEKIGVIHYGFSKGVSEFISRQECVREVLRVTPRDRRTFQEVADRGGADYTFVPGRFLPHVLAGLSIPSEDVALTQARWPWGSWPVNRPGADDVQLSRDAVEWAANQAVWLGDFIMVQPYSTNSVDAAAHWPHWSQAIRWLVNERREMFVFTGLVPIDGFDGVAHVVDMIGQTPTMEHLLALAEHARGVVTTCNALSLWTAIKGIPALVCANAAIPNEASYYMRWIRTPPNQVLSYGATFEEWREAAAKFLLDPCQEHEPQEVLVAR